MSEESKERSKDESGQTWIQSLPAIIGLTLGTIYALGAFAVFGQLYAADVSPTQALAFVPVDQMLARGIASLMSPALYLAGLIVLLYGLRMLLEMAFPADGEKKELQGDPSPKARGRTARALAKLDSWADRPLAMAGFLVVLLGLVAPPAILFSLLITFLGALTVMWLTRHVDWQRHRHYDGLFFTWIITFSLIGAAVTSFLQANPLPEASLVLRNGVCINGGLVLNTGDTWYIKRSGNQISATPARNVRVADVRFLDVPPEQDLLDFLTGWHPLPILGRITLRLPDMKTSSSPSDCRDPMSDHA